MTNPANALPALPDARPLRVVLDTNVVMALWHFCDPRLAGLKAWVENDAVSLIGNAACLGELQRVLAYRQFAIEAGRQAELFAGYQARIQVQAEPDEARLAELASLPRCGDRDDQKFLELAIHGEAQLLVSRDKLVLKLGRRRELRERLLILTPERLQQVLDAAIK